MRMKGKKVIFNYEDTWNMGYLLADIIAVGLEKFLEIEDDYKGVPSSFISELYDGNEWKHTDEQLEFAAKLWEDLLRLIITSVREPEPDYSGGFHEGPDHDKETKLENDTYTYNWDMVPNDEDSWNKYLNDLKNWEMNRSVAMEYFGKHIYDIWW